MVSADPEGLSRRERRKLEVRNRILEAAMALSDEQGFNETTVAEICERADIAHKTFFNHFPSKRDVLREIAGFALDDFLTKVEAARKQPLTTRERLLQVFDQIGESSEQGGPMRRDLLTEMIHVAHEAGTETEQTRRLHEAFGGLVRDGLAAGDVTRRHSPETLTEMVLGAMYAVMFDWTSIDHYPVRERSAAAGRFLGDALAPHADEQDAQDER